MFRKHEYLISIYILHFHTFQAAAATEVNWKDAGEKVGVEVWRVENRRDEKDLPQFGIKPWPIARYGEFYRGNIYVVFYFFDEPNR